jgi:IstB-like ATP binding protein
VTKAGGAIDRVVVASPHSGPDHDPRILQIDNDLLDRPLGDTHQSRHISKPYVGVSCQRHHHMSMVGQEHPLARFHPARLANQRSRISVLPVVRNICRAGQSWEPRAPLPTHRPRRVTARHRGPVAIPRSQIVRLPQRRRRAAEPRPSRCRSGKVDRLGAAHHDGRLQDELRRLGRYPLLVVDEVGYIPFEPEAANLFFQLVSSRYERASLIVTSNKPFGR